MPIVTTAAIPAFATGMLSLPAHLVTLVAGAGVDSVAGSLQVVLHTLVVCLLVPTALVHWRRARGNCVRCGRQHPEAGHARLRYPGASTAGRQTLLTVYLLLGGLLPWAVTKSVWTLGGDALGVTATAWQAVNEGHSPLVDALAALGVDVTVLASTLGILLPLSLVHRWGQVLPRWVPFLGGSRVPRLTLLLPAWMFGVGLALYGVVLVTYASLTGLGALPAPRATEPFTSPAGVTWMTLFGGLAFGGLGGGMLVGAHSYGDRTRPWCHVPHQGELSAGP
ncbi:hypothetical protein J4H86_19860 [Spiractinospora alimapuensis]|uniref:hypothetical protein n=1 Tax=Spiractinospora alimapuensis TaxID=2820884 RepID=UPI001F2CD68E|nr:hypothetical protein [Spiractinospora alimapuensis]QVQ51078.1 hypothetical protein J4H86_19860 [Spiractinospora alimapuensis]